MLEDAEGFRLGIGHAEFREAGCQLHKTQRAIIARIHSLKDLRYLIFLFPPHKVVENELNHDLVRDRATGLKDLEILAYLELGLLGHVHKKVLRAEHIEPLVGQAYRRRWSPIRPHIKHLTNQILRLRRNPLPHLISGIDLQQLKIHYLIPDLLFISSVEEGLPFLKHEIHDHSQAPDVDFFVILLIFEHFGSLVVSCCADDALQEGLAVVKLSRTPKIRKFHLNILRPITLKHNGLRLQISVHHIDIVHVLHTLQELQHDSADLCL